MSGWNNGAVMFVIESGAAEIDETNIGPLDSSKISLLQTKRKKTKPILAILSIYGHVHDASQIKY